jgi:deoxycytidylate deaminase
MICYFYLYDLIHFYFKISGRPLNRREEAFNHIFETNLSHHKNWGQNDAVRTCLIYTVDGETSDIIWNKESAHAEEQLIGRLESDERLRVGVNVVIHVYINSSPCRNCAYQLVAFLNRNKKVHLRVYIASLYNIRRQSCIKKLEDHVKLVSQEQSDENAEGLRQLMQHSKCKLMVFDRQAWYELSYLLQIPLTNFDEQYVEKLDKNDRSRLGEDKDLEEDWRYISINPCKFCLQHLML